MSSDTLKQKFTELKKEGLPALLTYTVGGDPSKDVSLEIFKSIAESGADIIECGLGHSANIGDGAAIQDSTYRALSNGIQTDDVFSIIKSFKDEYSQDVIIMTYQNKIMSHGEKNFIEKCVASHVSGIICVDYPWPTNMSFADECKKNNITFIQLLSPTTSEERLKLILDDSHDVCYYISQLSTTGSKLKVSSEEILNKFNLMKSIAPEKNFIIGFGITLDTIQSIKDVDAIVVGSALCKEISRSVNESQNPATNIGNMVKQLKEQLTA